VDDVIASSSDALLNGALAVAGERTVRLTRCRIKGLRSWINQTWERTMQKANAVGGVLSLLSAVVWLLVGAAGWPVWIGVVFSMLVGGYWAFGRQLVAGGEMGSREGRRRDRS